MKLSQALRLPKSPCLAIVGAGGKTSALFQLARELVPGTGAVIVTATTHLHIDQIKRADSHHIVEQSSDLSAFLSDLHGVVLVTGPVDGERTRGLNSSLISQLHEIQQNHHLPLLIEADGSRQRLLKAPAENEPVIPEFVELVVVVAGLTGMAKPLSEQFVHRPEIYARLSGLKPGETITPEGMVQELNHPSGGLKNIPREARCVVLLNQADTPGLQAQAKMIAAQLLVHYQEVISASLDLPSASADRHTEIFAVYERVAGIILAGGGSSRFGQSKQLLEWRGQPFVRVVAETALTAGLSPVVVVTGAEADKVDAALIGLPVVKVNNPDWQNGQSSSIQRGLHSLAKDADITVSPSLNILEGNHEQVGAAIFLLADQPQVTPTILVALCEEHARTLAPIIAPLISGKRANPVLFDRSTFPDLRGLTGDVGGRAIFNKHPVDYLPWSDETLLLDVDTPDDYRELLGGK